MVEEGVVRRCGWKRVWCEGDVVGEWCGVSRVSRVRYEEVAVR